MGLDAIMLIVVLFCISIASVIGYKVIKDVNDDVQNDSTINPQAKATLQQATTDYPTLMDNGFIFMLGLLWVLAIVASFFVDAHPIFLIVAVIVLIVVLFIGAAINNAYAEFTDDSLISTEAAAFPRTAWVMDHLILVILVISITIGIALYGKNKYG